MPRARAALRWRKRQTPASWRERSVLLMAFDDAPQQTARVIMPAFFAPAQTEDARPAARRHQRISASTPFIWASHRFRVGLGPVSSCTNKLPNATRT